MVQKVVDQHADSEPTNSEQHSHISHSPHSSSEQSQAQTPQQSSTHSTQNENNDIDAGNDADNELDASEEVDGIEVSQELNFELNVARNTLNVVKELLTRVFKGQVSDELLVARRSHRVIGKHDNDVDLMLGLKL